MQEIAKALIEAQKELPLVIAKESDGIVRDGQHRKYAGLENIIEKVRPILNKHGISLLQPGRIEDGQYVCRTILLHTSGETIEAEWPVQGAKDTKLHPDQCLGLGLSFARRYSLPSLLGIGTGEQDLDASELPKKEEQRQAQQQQGQQEPPEKEEPTMREWFDGQIGHYRSALGADFDAEVKRRGVHDLDAIKTPGDAKALIAGLKNEVDKRAAGGGQ